MPFDVPRCLVKNIEHQSRCAVPVARAVDTALGGAGAVCSPTDARRDLRQLQRHDLRQRCSTVRDGVVRYQDSNHLSVRYVTSLAGMLSDSLSRALVPPPAIAIAPRQPASPR